MRIGGYLNSVKTQKELHTTPQTVPLYFSNSDLVSFPFPYSFCYLSFSLRVCSLIFMHIYLFIFCIHSSLMYLHFLTTHFYIYQYWYTNEWYVRYGAMSFRHRGSHRGHLGRVWSGYSRIRQDTNCSTHCMGNPWRRLTSMLKQSWTKLRLYIWDLMACPSGEVSMVRTSKESRSVERK